MTKPTMAAAVINRFGGISEIHMEQVPLPQVGDDDVLIQMEAAGAASWDAVEREGQYDGYFGTSTFPYILGWDGAGKIVEVGRNVGRFQIGDRVYAASMPLPRGGFYAEYAVVDAEHVAHIPGKLTIQQAGVMGWDALTALSGLETLNLTAGETLMIFGASGGIGHMAVQLALHKGVRVFAVASGDDGVTLAERLGAHATVNGRKDDVEAAARRFSPGGLDAALVMVGGEASERALRALRSTGRIAVPYGVQPEPKTPPGMQLFMYNGDRRRTATDKLNAIIEASSFEVHVAKTFHLDEAEEAHRMLGTHYLGKLALLPPRKP